MLALAGYPLGFRFRFFDSTAGPAAHVAECVTADFDDLDALDRFGQDLDVITYEFENVPAEAVDHLCRTVPVFPSSRALQVSQHRLEEKRYLARLGIATAEFRDVTSPAELRTAVADLGPSTVLKTARHGYDGRGQLFLNSSSDLEAAWLALEGRELILEKLVPFERELSLVSVRARSGEVAFYPLVENAHSEGILATTIAPATHVSDALTALAREYATRILTDFDYVGVLSIELFQIGETLLANEIAPRVHNSGHWTIEGADTSQFANHIRAIAGMPLGSSAPRGWSRMTNVIGALPPVDALLRVSHSHVHLYDKAPRPRRKLGHVTVVAPSEAAADAAHAEVGRIVAGTAPGTDANFVEPHFA